MRTTTFETAKVGDKVWSFNKGWGMIIEIYHDDFYPLLVSYGSKGLGHGRYTLDGKTWSKHANPTIFWDEIEIVAPPKPLPKLEVDTKLLVWDDGSEEWSKLKRYFSHFDEKGRIFAFEDGRASWSGEATVPWDNWEVAE